MIPWASIDFGTFPDWIGGIGTASATLLLAGGWLRERRLRRLEQERHAATVIRQALLEIERLYDGPLHMDYLPDSESKEERKLVRDIQAQSALLSEPYAEQFFRISTFYSDPGIVQMGGNAPRSIARQSCSYGKLMANTILRRKMRPPPTPKFYLEYESLQDEYAEIMEDNYRSEMEERMGRINVKPSSIEK